MGLYRKYKEGKKPKSESVDNSDNHMTRIIYVKISKIVDSVPNNYRHEFGMRTIAYLMGRCNVKLSEIKEAGL